MSNTVYNKVTIDGTTIMDISDTTAAASDVASGKYFYTAGGVKTAGTASGGSATLITKSISANGTYNASSHSADGYSSVTVAVPSPWTQIKSNQELTVQMTSTTASSAGTIACGSAISNKTQIIWVHIRDKSGPQSGCFYGSDAFFVNTQKANSSTSTFSAPAIECIRYTTSNTYAATTGAYGVYGYSIANDGTLTIRKRYNSSYTLTIDSTYVIDVYTLDIPSGEFLFPAPTS